MLLENISLLETWKHFCERAGAILFISLFFRWASEYPLFQISRTLVHFFLIFFSMNNFFIAQCFFSATKFWRDSNQSLEHLFGGYRIKHIFGVYSQCRSETFLVGSRWNDKFLRLPPVQEQCICGWCVRDLDFKSMTNLS